MKNLAKAVKQNFLIIHTKNSEFLGLAILKEVEFP